VRYRDGAVAEASEEVLDLGGPFPDDDRFGAVGGAERVNESVERGRSGGSSEKAMEVVAEGAAGTKAAAMVSRFGVAALAVEVVGDVGAGRADGVALGVGWPW
jgi:hypothetical protein